MRQALRSRALILAVGMWSAACASAPIPEAEDTSAEGIAKQPRGIHLLEGSDAVVRARRLRRPVPLGFQPGDCGFDPVYTLYSREDPSGSISVMTKEDVVRHAEKRARDRGWTEAFCGVLVLGVGTPSERRVVIDPLTVENLRAADVRLVEVDWVMLRRVP